MSVILIALFAFFLRTKLYILGNVFEDDECRLALAIMDKSLLQMFLPIGPLSSTPIFLFISKIIAELTNYNEYALKFIPYFFSIASLVLFYKISTAYFQRKISVLLAFYFFSINKFVLYFSSIFKTYSIEVFITLVCLYYFPKINLMKLDKKKLILLSVSITLLPLISLPSLFFIGLFLLFSIIENFKNKLFYGKFAAVLIPFLSMFSLYYFINLLPTKKLQMEGYSSFWQHVYSASFIADAGVIAKFVFAPNNYPLFILIILSFFLIYIICVKKERTKFNAYLGISLFMSAFVSYIKLYPTLIGRTALFIVPVVVMALIKLLDVLDTKHLFFYIICFLFAIGTHKYFSLLYLKEINDVVPTFRNYSPQSLIREIKIKANPKTDVIVTTESSMYSFVFYAIKEQYKIDYLIPKPKSEDNDGKNYYYNYFNDLNPDKKYWFYLIKEYEYTPQREYAIEWLKGQNVLYSKKELDSYLYYIFGIKKKEL